MSKMSLFVKGTVIATVVALAFSSVAFAKERTAKERNVKAPATTATSTPASAQATTQFIQSNWKYELAWLNFDNAILSRVDRLAEGIAHRLDKDLNSKRSDDRLPARVEMTAQEVQSLLARAQAIATTHAGFDAKGNVTDQTQAMKSVQSLGADLAALRGTLIYRLEQFV